MNLLYAGKNYEDMTLAAFSVTLTQEMHHNVTPPSLKCRLKHTQQWAKGHRLLIGADGDVPVNSEGHSLFDSKNEPIIHDPAWPKPYCTTDDFLGRVEGFGNVYLTS